MSHAKGTYLGGIRTPEDLRKRSTVVPVTDCWIWSLARCDGHPRIWLSEHVPGMKAAARITGPRAAFILRHGRPPKAGHNAYMRCLSVGCINPEHVVEWTREEHGAFVSRVGVLKGNPHRTAMNRANKRKGAKLDHEKARAIRASDETQTVLAQRYGVPQSTIGYVKSGRLWREDTAPAPVTRAVVEGDFVYVSRLGAFGVARSTAGAVARMTKAAA